MPGESSSTPAKARRAVVALACAAATIGVLASASSAPAGIPASSAINCTPFGADPCLLPFPHDLFTKKDPSTFTGRRVDLPQAAMPVGNAGAIDVAPYDRNDGFDPGSSIIVRAPGLDTPAAMDNTNPVQQDDISRYTQANAPIVLIDAKTGKRQMIWAELDSTAPSVDTTSLLIHPAKLLPEGRRYIVAMRNLRDASNAKLAAPQWFERLRDGKSLPSSERHQAKRYASIFKSLKNAGIARKPLYEAWDFTVASRQSLAKPMLRIRNDAFHQLGDSNLADGVAAGHAPAFTVDSTTTTGLAAGIAEEIKGTFQVPCYLDSANCAIGGSFNYDSGSPYQRPVQMPGNMATAHYSCAIPSSATAANKARALTYGHGLFGSDGEATNGTGGNQAGLAADHNFMSCGTESWGLANDPSCTPGPCDPGTEADVTYDAGVLQNLSGFPTVGDRLEQSILNTMYLGRLMRTTDGFAANAAFQDGGSNPLFDTGHLYYYGNSQGGIMGGAVTALSPDIRRSVLGVPGTDYGGLLLQRSSDFVGGATPFDLVVKSSYTDTAQFPLILDLVEQIWDRGEAEAYAENMTSDPLPRTPSHKVLMHVAYGDHQVSMYAAAVEARTIGAKAYEPGGSALDPARSRDANLLFGIDPLPSLPFDGSGIVIWDSGPGRVDPPPFGNVPPTTANDPHSDPRKTVAARAQISAFLDDATGTITDACAAAPCHTDAFVP